MKKKNHLTQLLIIAAVAGAVVSIPKMTKVSNSVNGRELPVYSVETEKKQAALTFDAAWEDVI